MHRRLELDLRTIQSELRHKNFVHSSEALGPTGEFFLAKEHGYRRVDDFIFLHVLDFVVGHPYSLAMTRKDLVCIQITIRGAYTRRSGDRVDLVNPALLQITNFPYSISDAETGTRLRGILIVCDRAYLLEHFGLQVDNVPKFYRPIFANKVGMSEALTLPTSPSMIANTDQIISCKHGDPLRSIYLRAKTLEIVCDVVAQVNMLLTRKPFRMRTDQSKAQAIETAAAIYRRELHNPPTIEQLAFRVGLNRNELTAGFRSLLGVTPHAYVNLMRMEQAQSLLQSGWLSISEIARRVGYEGYSSFSRAYRAHFGHAPSTWKDQQRGSGTILTPESDG
jgi:AraC-like DNA-binding protein